jgi:hypothetical protein
MGGMKITNDCLTCYSIVKTFVYWCSFVTTFYFTCSFALIGSFVVFGTCTCSFALTCSFVTFVLDNTGASIMFSTTAFS